MDNVLRDWNEGMRRALPIMLGYAPVGFAFGVLAVKNGISPGFAVALSVLMFSGSGQFVFVNLWGQGAGVLAVACAVGIANLRYLLMSAAEAPWLCRLPLYKKILLGYGITDETFAFHITAMQKGLPPSFLSMLVCNSASASAWILGGAAGAFCGALVDDVKPLGLDFAITAMFLALIVPLCHRRLDVFTAVFSAALSIALKGLGLGQWNVAIATVCGASLALAICLRLEAGRGGAAA